jgi:chromate transporter
VAVLKRSRRKISLAEWQAAVRDGWQGARAWLGEQFAPHEAQVGGRALAQAFFKLGATAFGGGIAVITQVRRTVVRERRWLSDGEFLDAVSLAQSLPGANAANAVTYVGLRLAGVRGALIALCSFILPSFMIMMGLAIAHDYVAHLPDAQRVMRGFNAAVVGLIAATTVRLSKTAMQQQWHLELGVAAGFMLVFTQTTVAEIVLLAGIIGIAVRSYKTRARQHARQRIRKERQTSARSIVAEQQARQQAAAIIENPDELASDYKVEVALPEPAQDELANKEAPPAQDAADQSRPHDPATSDDAPPEAPRAEQTSAGIKLRSCAALILLLSLWPLLENLITVWQLATIFLRIGAVTFGGGFVMIPQVEADIVEVHGWMDRQTFADGMAFMQITPGPVLITATFIGYKVAGPIGALATTIAAFLPSFVMTVIAGTSLNRFRTNFLVQSFLAGVAPAVVGMLAAAAVSLGKSGLSTPLSYGVATLAFLLMLRARLNPVVIVFGCGLLQWAVSRGLISWLHI